MRDLANSAIASGVPLTWYDALYRDAEAGTAEVPWDDGEPLPVLVDWSTGRYPDRTGGDHAVVVGCGYGDDAEFVARLGFVTAFDISETARRRHVPSRVDYRQADLLAPPTSWLQAFDLVVESTTLQGLPPDLHEQAAAAVAGLRAPGGTVLIIARQPSRCDPHGPPWLLAEPEVRRVAVIGVELARLDTVSMTGGHVGWPSSGDPRPDPRRPAVYAVARPAYENTPRPSCGWVC